MFTPPRGYPIWGIYAYLTCTRTCNPIFSDHCETQWRSTGRHSDIWSLRPLVDDTPVDDLGPPSLSLFLQHLYCHRGHCHRPGDAHPMRSPHWRDARTTVEVLNGQRHPPLSSIADDDEDENDAAAASASASAAVDDEVPGDQRRWRTSETAASVPNGSSLALQTKVNVELNWIL